MKPLMSIMLHGARLSLSATVPHDKGLRPWRFDVLPRACLTLDDPVMAAGHVRATPEALLHPNAASRYEHTVQSTSLEISIEISCSNETFKVIRTATKIRASTSTLVPWTPYEAAVPSERLFIQLRNWNVVEMMPGSLTWWRSFGEMQIRSEKSNESSFANRQRRLSKTLHFRILILLSTFQRILESTNS